MNKEVHIRLEWYRTTPYENRTPISFKIIEARFTVFL